MMKMLIVLVLVFLLQGCSIFQGPSDALEGLSFKNVSQERLLLQARYAYNLNPTYQTGNLPVSMQAPLLHEGLIYVLAEKKGMQAYDIKTGRVLWESKDSSGNPKIEEDSIAGSSFGGAAVFEDQVIYGSVDGSLYSRDLLTGKLKYQVNVGSGPETTPVVFDGRLYLHTRSHKIVALDASTGKMLWSYTRSVPSIVTLQGASTPLVYKGRLYVGFADGVLAAFSVEDGNLIWETRLEVLASNPYGDADLPVTLIGDKIMIGTQFGGFYLVDSSSGQVVRKIEKAFTRAPQLIDGHYLALGRAGDIITYDSSMAEKSVVKILTATPLTSLVKWKGFYAASTLGGELLILDPIHFTIKERKWMGVADSAFYAPLMASGETLVAYSARHYLYIF